MQYIPKIKSTSGLSDGVQKKQRLFSGENKPTDSSVQQQRDASGTYPQYQGGRKAGKRCKARQRNTAFSQLHRGQKVERKNFIFSPSVQTDRRQNSFKATDSVSTTGTLSDRWSSPPGFKTSRGGRGLTGYKGDRRYHLCHLLADGDCGDAGFNQRRV